ncbi:MAG: tRNA 2-thiouridine(34) synthase MnmA [Lachnospiraceae bacterium]|nr:tRNA 2-thiouridine(34) synthase MnmA [Lachnospiraceae bacterium]
MAKIIVGMSGGVDSAVTAYLLKAAGHDCIGVTLKIWGSEENAESKCCEIDDAQRVAQFLDIPYYVQHCVCDFKGAVVEPFIDSYLNGETPNPCIECNRRIKWAKMIEAAKVYGADYVATGHYANIVKLENGRYTVKNALYAAKDQTYMLCRLTQEQLAMTLMPLGGMSKDEVRAIAQKVGIPVASKPDSQDICFVTNDGYADFIMDHAGERAPGEGDFIDEDGRVLGRHKGIIHYTVGQRKGLGISMGEPVYVKEIRPETNEVVLSSNGSLFSTTVTCDNADYMGILPPKPGEKIPCKAKIRYRHTPERAVLEVLEEKRVRLVFESPVRAATPGQSVVFYDDDGCVIGSAVIVKA